MPTSAGLVIYRLRDGELEVLLVHPSGNYNRKAPWGIPKGLVDAGETLAETACRETREETGVVVAAEAITALGSVDYTKSRKRVHGFAAAAPPDADPRCASWEVDRAEFVPLAGAVERIHPDQRAFLERLVAHLASAAPRAG